MPKLMYKSEYPKVKKELMKMGLMHKGDAVVISQLSPYMKNHRILTIFHTHKKRKPIVKIDGKEYVIS